MEEGAYKQVEESTVYQNPWITFKRRVVERPDKSLAEWGVMELASDAVFIVPLTDKNQVVLMRQFRVPLADYFWEISSGGADGEEPLVAAKRELQEEMHMEADEWEKIGVLNPYPTFCTEKAHLFLARKLRGIEGNRAEQIVEGISEIRTFSFSEVLKMIDEGEITHGTTVNALLRVAIKLGLC